VNQVAAAPGAKRTLKTYLEFVKFEHTLFALPFAYAGMLLATRSWPGWGVFFWITLAMIGARTASMALNRVIDAEIDARNPRTASREIPRGVLGKRSGVLLALVGFALLALAGWALNPLTLALLPVAVLFLTLYPYLKRFTWLCHLWLGVTIGAAAAGGWIAVTGAFAPAAWTLWAGVACWIAGFDVIYGVLDYEFDTQNGVHSIPADFGVETGLEVSAALHLLAWGFLALTLPLSDSSWPFALGLGAVAVVLVWGQKLARSSDLGGALRAFNGNLYVSGVMLLAVMLDIAR
jgi:4-hydroxybenzoate polyprenyltransferase